MHRLGSFIVLAFGLLAMHFSDTGNIPESTRTVGLWFIFIGLAVSLIAHILLVLLRYKMKRPMISYKTVLLIMGILFGITRFMSSIFVGDGYLQ